jgi:hypothetical protein
LRPDALKRLDLVALAPAASGDHVAGKRIGRFAQARREGRANLAGHPVDAARPGELLRAAGRDLDGLLAAGWSTRSPMIAISAAVIARSARAAATMA